MAYAKLPFGKVHKYLAGSNYTRCGKKIKHMNKNCGAGNQNNRCSACWNS